VRPGNLANEGKPEAMAFNGVPFTRPGDAVETFKNVFPFTFSDAGAVVGNGENRFVGLAGNRDFYFSRLAAVFAGVVQQVINEVVPVMGPFA